MFKITLSPFRGDGPLALSKQGDALTIGGEVFDFGPLPNGADLPREAVDCDYLASDVRRVDGVLSLTLRFPYGSNAPKEARFPEPISVVGDGPIELPLYDAAVDDAEGEGEA